MPSNAEHIASLKRISIQHPGCTKAIAAAIHALKAEGRSPWRKVTKRHPGKKWVGVLVIAALETGDTVTTRMPSLSDYIIHGWRYKDWKCFHLITHWQPWPEHPEEVK